MAVVETKRKKLNYLLGRLRRVEAKIGIIAAPFDELREDLEFLKGAFVEYVEELQKESDGFRQRAEELEKEIEKTKKEVDELRKIPSLDVSKISSKKKEVSERG